MIFKYVYIISDTKGEVVSASLDIFTAKDFVSENNKTIEYSQNKLGITIIELL